MSALAAYSLAQRNGGRFLLRIEDIDPDRCRPEYERAIYEDLAWLGIEWETPVRRQSEHLADYAAALDRLRNLDVVYPCFCSRRETAHQPIYGGACRNLVRPSTKERAPCWRLRADKAAHLCGPLLWQDRLAGRVEVQPDAYGDVVIARRDVPTSYHLAVTVDDHLQNITDVVRGHDLFDSTPIHRTLQTLLGFETPRYLHHPLLLDPATGRKLAKRDGSTSLRSLRAQGVRPEDLRSALECDAAYRALQDAWILPA